MTSGAYALALPFGIKRGCKMLYEKYFWRFNQKTIAGFQIAMLESSGANHNNTIRIQFFPEKRHIFIRVILH